MGPRFSFVVHFSPTRLTDSRNGLQRKLVDDRFIRGRREAFYQMQLFAGSRNAVRFVKLVVSTISACVTESPCHKRWSAYRSNSLRAGTSGVHASTRLCMRAS